jgi:arylsulfatase A-like enzyme
VTIPEFFKDLGYHTGAVSSQPWISPQTGFDQGFDHFEVVSAKEDPLETEKVVRGGLRWIEGHRDRPFFLYMHTMNPHDPYDPPPPYDDIFWQRDVPQKFRGAELSAKFIRRLGKLPMTPDEMAYLRAAYDAQIAYADSWIGVFADQLRDWRILGRTLIIITSDHGESFREHGRFLHGTHVFNTNLHVPLLLVNPTLFQQQVRVSRTVQSIDIFPTLVHLFGEAPIPQLQGTSLLADEPGFAMSEGGRREFNYKVQDGEWSLVMDAARGVLLFNLRDDPGEQRDLSGAHPDVRERLLARLVELQAENLQNPYRPRPEVRTMDAEMRERLEALGYLE